MDYDMFEDIELDTKRVNKAYEDAYDLLDDLYIKDGNLIDDFTNEIRSNMIKENPFEHYNPTSHAIANLYKATETIIHVVYPNALVTWNSRNDEINVDNETYRLAVKRLAEDYEIDEETELRRLGVIQ